MSRASNRPPPPIPPHTGREHASEHDPAAPEAMLEYLRTYGRDPYYGLGGQVPRGVAGASYPGESRPAPTAPSPEAPPPSEPTPRPFAARPPPLPVPDAPINQASVRSSSPSFPSSPRRTPPPLPPRFPPPPPPIAPPRKREPSIAPTATFSEARNSSNRIPPPPPAIGPIAADGLSGSYSGGGLDDLTLQATLLTSDVPSAERENSLAPTNAPPGAPVGHPKHSGFRLGPAAAAAVAAGIVITLMAFWAGTVFQRVPAASSKAGTEAPPSNAMRFLDFDDDEEIANLKPPRVTERTPSGPSEPETPEIPLPPEWSASSNRVSQANPSAIEAGAAPHRAVPRPEKAPTPAVSTSSRAQAASEARSPQASTSKATSPGASALVAAASSDSGTTQTTAKKNPDETSKEATESEKLPPAGPFDTSAARTALVAAAANASTCRGNDDPSGVAQVVVTFAPSGTVTSAVLNGPPFAGTPTGSCIARHMRNARVPPFSGSNVTVSKTLTIR